MFLETEIYKEDIEKSEHLKLFYFGEFYKKLATALQGNPSEERVQRMIVAEFKEKLDPLFSEKGIDFTEQVVQSDLFNFFV